MKSNLYVEFQGDQISERVIMDVFKEKWKTEGKKMKDIQSLEMYYKPEEKTCYYVVNDMESGRFSVYIGE